MLHHVKNGAWFMTINAKTNEFNALLKELALSKKRKRNY